MPRKKKRKVGHPKAGEESASDEEFLEALAQGLTTKELAQKFGITPATVSIRKKRLQVASVKALTKEDRAERAIDHTLDAVQLLQKNNRHANWLLDHLMRWIQGDDEAIQVLEKQARRVKVGKGKDPKWVTEYKFKDPHTVALSAMSEIREQLKLQLDMFKAFYSLQAIQEFMRAVLDAVNSVDPVTRDRIITELNRSRAMGATSHWFTGAGSRPGPGRGVR